MRNVEKVLLETRRVPQMAILSAKGQFGDDSEAMLQYFMSQKGLTEKEIYIAFAKVMKLDFVNLRNKEIHADALASLPASFCRKENLIPIEIYEDKIVVATSDPDNFTAFDEISASTYHDVVKVIVSPSDLDEAMDRYLRTDQEIDQLSEQIEKAVEEENDDDDLSDLDDESPIVRFVNLLIAQAIQDRASDIHVEPGERELTVRYRIDGVLKVAQKTEATIQKGVVSRLKVMSNIDIGERRKPQDGRLSLKHAGKTIDIRVVTLPTTWGEKVVMRILDHSEERRSIDTIEMSPENQEIFERCINRPHGMILVTGPTGSGKALPLNTKIPTPFGFTTMEEIQEDDEVIGSDGKIYKVTSTSEIDEYAEMFELTFSDGQKIVADANHQWLVSTASGRAIKSSQKKAQATKDYVDAHKTLTKLAYLSLEFSSECGSRTEEEILSLLQKEDIHYYKDSKAISQSLRMVDVYGLTGFREDISGESTEVLEYPIEEALIGLSSRIRQQHAVVQASETPVVRVTTREMVENGLFVGKNNERKNYAVPVAKSVEFPEKDLLIDPYVFGVWLGDGHKETGSITIGEEDQEALLGNLSELWGNIKVTPNDVNSCIKATLVRPDSNSCIYGHDDWVVVGPLKRYSYCRTCGTSTRNISRRTQRPVNGSLGELLAHIGVRNNKHIPTNYLRASFKQRLDLLQGLVDSDGHISKSGSTEISFADKGLTEDVTQLVRSLGIKASVKYDAKGGYKDKVGNKVEKIRHRIHFTTDLEISRLERKKRNLPETIRKTSEWNYITNVEKLDVQPAKCISVNSPDFTYLVGEGFITTSNSTTIYTALGEVSKPTVNVVTVEDPVEKKIPGISQIQINNKAGMTFSSALRSILRADPDIVFLGEIRDEETAKIAVDASMTGHLVLSTLHTNGAPESAARLTEMGVEPYLVGSSVSCVVAQRLARRLCNDCKQPIEVDRESLEKAEFPYFDAQLYKPIGCNLCSQTGYRGRVALTEVMEITEAIEPFITAQKSANEIRREAEKHGLVSLRDDGYKKVRSGLTTIEEVMRVAS